MTHSCCQSGEKRYWADKENSSIASSQLNSNGPKSENFSLKQKKTQTRVQIRIMTL